MVASPSPSPKKPKRDISDFFKPYARHGPLQTIPKKRLSPFADRVDDDDECRRPPRAHPKTPAKSVSFKDMTPTPKSTFRQPGSPPRSGASLPIRSPSVNKTIPANPPDYSQRKLFAPNSPTKTTSDLAHEPLSDLNVSFAFSDVSDRSQAVVRDGKVIAVRDSDDDSDDSLASLSDLVTCGNKGRSKQTAANATLFHTGRGDKEQDRYKAQADQTVSLLNRFTPRDSVPIIGKNKLRAIYSREKDLKFDLASILDDHFEDEEVEERIRRTRQDLSDDDNDANNPPLEEVGQKRLLENVILNGNEEADADDVARVMGALARTEALSGERSFSFFDWKKVRLQEQKPQVQDAFPVNAVPSRLWRDGDRSACMRAYTSGIMAERASRGQLCEEALRWTFSQLPHEEQETLQSAYLQTLRVASAAWTRLNVTAADVQLLFHDLGASSDVLRDNMKIEPKFHTLQRPTTDFRRLLRVLELFQVISADLDMLSLSKLISIILRLSLDEIAMSDGQVVCAVETLLDTLLSLPNADTNSHVHDRLLSDASQNLHNPALQAKLLSHIPASSSKACQLRKMLADVFLLGPSHVDPATNASSASLDQLRALVDASAAFQLTRRSSATPNDYAALTSLISILDVAIGPGHSIPLPSLTISSDTSIGNNVFANQKHSTPPEILAFNKSLDALAESLHTLLVSIKDSGASHMRRTEAKDILQALYYRLLYHVRIGQRKKIHVFDTFDFNTNGQAGSAGKKTKKDKRVVGIDGQQWRQEEKGRQVMHGFLQRSGHARPRNGNGDGSVSEMLVKG